MVRVTWITESEECIIVQVPLVDASRRSSQRWATLWEDWNKAVGYSVLRMHLRLRIAACIFRKRCSSSLARVGSERALCQRSLSKLAHGRSHEKSNVILK
jgi:hypothetical protein